MNIFRTFWKSARDLFEELFALGLANILWLIVNAPVVIAALLFVGNLGALLVILLIGVLTIGPSTAGLYVIADRVVEGRTSSWRAPAIACPR